MRVKFHACFRENEVMADSLHSVGFVILVFVGPIVFLR